MKQFRPAIAVILLFICSYSTAEVGDDDPIESRQNAMKEMGKSMKVLGKIYTHKVPYEFEVVKIATDRLLTSSDSISLLHMFPEGSLDKDSKSKSEIWDSWDEFSDMMFDFEKSVNDFEVVARMGLDASAVEFKHLTKSCSVCHKKYRTKRKK